MQEKRVERNGRQDSSILSPSPKCHVQSVYKKRMRTGGEDSFPHSLEILSVPVHYVPGTEPGDGSTKQASGRDKVNHLDKSVFPKDQSTRQDGQHQGARRRELFMFGCYLSCFKLMSRLALPARWSLQTEARLELTQAYTE